MQQVPWGSQSVPLNPPPSPLRFLQEENPSGGNLSRMSFDPTCPTRAEEFSAWQTRVPTPTSPSCKSSVSSLFELIQVARLKLNSSVFALVLSGFVPLSPPASSHSARAPTWTGSTQCLEGKTFWKRPFLCALLFMFSVSSASFSDSPVIL